MADIRSLIRNVDEMPHGSARVEAAKELWSRAQQDSNPRLRYEAICETLESALFGGALDYFLVLFPQMVKIKREHPEAVDLWSYVWRIKWLATSMLDYPEVPLERIRMAEAEYERELRDAGGSPRTAIYLRWSNALEMGRLDEAEPLMAEFMGMRRDSHADCFACEANALVRDALQRDDHKTAEARAADILSGRTRCAEIPHTTLGYLALSAELNDEAEKAAVYHKKGYRLIRSNIKFVSDAGRHLAYLAAIGDRDRALRVLKTHAGWLEQNRTPISHYHFLTGATAVCQMIGETRRRPVKLDLPAKWLAAWGAEPLPLTELAQHFEREGLSLSAAFDRRNGNSWHSDRFKRQLERIRERREARPVMPSQEGQP